MAYPSAATVDGHSRVNPSEIFSADVAIISAAMASAKYSQFIGCWPYLVTPVRPRHRRWLHRFRCKPEPRSVDLASVVPFLLVPGCHLLNRSLFHARYVRTGYRDRDRTG